MIIKLHFFIALLLLSFFYACNHKEDKIINAANGTSKRHFCFDSIKNTSEEDLGRLFYNKYTDENGEKRYVAFSFGKDILYFFDKDGKLSKVDTLGNNIAINNLYIIDKDSFFIFSAKNYQFTMYEFVNGKIKMQWQPDNSENTVTLMRTYLVLPQLQDFRILQKNNHLLCVINSPVMDLSQRPPKDVSSGKPQLSIFELTNDGELRNDFSFASYDNIKDCYRDVITTFTYIDDNIIAYTTEAQPNIYFYNINSRKLIKDWNPRFKYFQKNTVFHTDSMSPDYTNRYLCSNTRKYFLKYNPANRTLYCMYTLPQSVNSDTVPIAYQGDFILATLDPFSYTIKQEYHFSGKDYYSGGAIFFDDKIGIARRVNATDYTHYYDIFSF